VEQPAEVEEAGDVEGDPGVPADEGLRVGVDGGMDADVGGLEEELQPEAALLVHGEPEGVAVELDGPVEVVHEDGVGMDALDHGRAPASRLRKAARQFRRILSRPGRSSGVSANRPANSASVIRSKKPGSSSARAPRS
jgi:hypothetical protein